MRQEGSRDPEAAHLSPIGKRLAPACCDDNLTHGFVLAVDTTLDGIVVRGVTFEVAVVDAVGVVHRRRVSRCPLCGTGLWQVSCVAVDAWLSDARVERAVSQVRESAEETK